MSKRRPGKCEVCQQNSRQRYCSNECAEIGQTYLSPTMKAKEYDALVKARKVRPYKAYLGPMCAVDADGCHLMVEAMARQERKERQTEQQRIQSRAIARAKAGLSPEELPVAQPEDTRLFAEYIFGAKIIERSGTDDLPTD